MAMKKATYSVEKDIFCRECSEALAQDYVMRRICESGCAGTCGRCGRFSTVWPTLYTMSKRGYDRLGIPYEPGGDDNGDQIAGR